MIFKITAMRSEMSQKEVEVATGEFSYVAINMNLFQLPISSPMTWIFAFVLYDFLYY